jgi:hypothetical protein
MIDTITVRLERFDLTGFIDAYRRFHRQWAGEEADTDSSVSIMDKFGGIPEPFPEDGDLVEELVQGRLLFFPMHEPLVAEDALSIDGTRRGVEDFDVGPADSYGFLVELNDEQVSLHPALYDGSGGRPTIDLQGRCSLLDKGMERFARRFVR